MLSSQCLVPLQVAHVSEVALFQNGGQVGLGDIVGKGAVAGKGGRKEKYRARMVYGEWGMGVAEWAWKWGKDATQPPQASNEMQLLNGGDFF